ncbi:uncharacterized protein BO97DRAFT_441473 [Aspergillus homomorphus CBS 101889]|uniref:Uncharacterized protein n=1 Tax=Aspergillus homomorphus (strain CBS 101889) TaxID=1450537 RepID=A0A395I5F8_ASPHC|nr:hypothetical protein BO97DRAFT_441473 [Aspergillus homomorphus CBS 101889]RAL15006.1 hypothetical protein BO97DRAFT_441473 [Aspergillus homomorphus CBS 101889]
MTLQLLKTMETYFSESSQNITDQPSNHTTDSTFKINVLVYFALVIVTISPTLNRLLRRGVYRHWLAALLLLLWSFQLFTFLLWAGIRLFWSAIEEPPQSLATKGIRSPWTGKVMFPGQLALREALSELIRQGTVQEHDIKAIQWLLGPWGRIGLQLFWVAFWDLALDLIELSFRATRVHARRLRRFLRIRQLRAARAARAARA